jgi:predicted site-specific integrase-resolvase
MNIGSEEFEPLINSSEFRALAGGVSRQLLWWWCKTGRIRYYQMEKNGMLRIPVSELRKVSGMRKSRRL